MYCTCIVHMYIYKVGGAHLRSKVTIILLGAGPAEHARAHLNLSRANVKPYLVIP